MTVALGKLRSKSNFPDVTVMLSMVLKTSLMEMMNLKFNKPMMTSMALTQYLPNINFTADAVPVANATCSATAVPPPDAVPTADALNNSYIRVVHTNGIHHMAMVTCQCQGEHRIPLDLVTSNLLPTSFTNIRTLFTVQVLDYFRLCNLELKASAYQFYQLIRRLTSPMRPAKVVNLYHELRRMSHLWRWMKRLKWAGYGHNQQDPLNPEPGTLANFCPACPQVGINIPENWKDDANQWVSGCLWAVAY